MELAYWKISSAKTVSIALSSSQLTGLDLFVCLYLLHWVMGPTLELNMLFEDLSEPAFSPWRALVYAERHSSFETRQSRVSKIAGAWSLRLSNHQVWLAFSPALTFQSSQCLMALCIILRGISTEEFAVIYLQLALLNVVREPMVFKGSRS